MFLVLWNETSLMVLPTSWQEFAYYGSTEVKQDNTEKIDETLNEEEDNGSAGEEAADGIEAKNHQKWA